MPARAGLEILEVEAEDVVALDRIGVPLADDPRGLLEQRALVQPVAAHDVAEAGGVGQRDGHDAIRLARGAREFAALAGHDLDVERHPAHVTEAHAAEGREPAGQQVLLDGIRKEPVGRRRQVGRDAGLGAAGVAGAERLAPRPEARQPAQLTGARQWLHVPQAGRGGDQGRVGQQQERREGDDVDREPLAVATPHADAAAVLRERERDEAGDLLAQPAASSMAERYTARSARPTSARPVSGTITVGMARTACSLTAAS